jgi:hypothetical protein
VDLPVELEPVELEPVELEAALVDAGFRSAAVTTTSRFFLLGRAEA